MRDTFTKVLSLSFISIILSACGSSATEETINEFTGGWKSACRYDSVTDVSSIETLYINDTQYTAYIDEFENDNCFGSSDYTTEIEGYLHFDHYRPFASSYCDNTVEVDFVTTAIFEDDVELTDDEISDYLDVPGNVTYNLMCSKNLSLFTGDFITGSGRSPDSRPIAMNYNNPLYFID